MSNLKELKPVILQEGADGVISDADVAMIRQHLPPGADLSAEDVEYLIELRLHATTVCPAFHEMFLPAFKRFLLRDGQISLEEQFHLLRLLYGGGGVDDAERQFLNELRREVTQPSPELQNLLDTAARS